MTYLDYNATTPLCQEAWDAMLPWLHPCQGGYGNPSSIHVLGRRARAAIDDARDKWASWLQVKSHELIFTGGGTESDNLAIIGLARRHRERGHHLITAATEHHAVLHAMKFLQEYDGFEVTYLPVDHDGVVHSESLREALRPETILVSIMQANNETGAIQPIKELAAICHERNILFHTDAIQSFGKISSLPQELGVDAWSIAAHKFYGPKGVGLLWLRSGTSIWSIQHGGAQEGERRPGTEDVASIVGMTAAAEVALRAVAEGVEAPHQRALREELWKGVTALYPRAKRHGSPETTLFNTLNVSFPGCDGETLLMALDLEGICLSSGSACMVGSIQASHVLQAMHVSEEEAHTAVRFSLGRGTTQEAIAKTLVALEKVIKRQKKK
ncbi:MAG: cysteine desulfurase [Chthoniobacterales bacterium]|nr:cysteine desulfurase [Chthoniobacterales bacterium]